MNATALGDDSILLEKFKDLGDTPSDVILFVLMDNNFSLFIITESTPFTT